MEFKRLAINLIQIKFSEFEIIDSDDDYDYVDFSTVGPDDAFFIEKTTGLMQRLDFGDFFYLYSEYSYKFMDPQSEKDGSFSYTLFISGLSNPEILKEYSKNGTIDYVTMSQNLIEASHIVSATALSKDIRMNAADTLRETVLYCASDLNLINLTKVFLGSKPTHVVSLGFNEKKITLFISAFQKYAKLIDPNVNFQTLSKIGIFEKIRYGSRAELLAEESYLYEFDDFNVLLLMTDRLQSSRRLSDIYYYDGIFYLAVRRLDDKAIENENLASILSEYGRESSKSILFLQEHGSKIFSENAVNTVNKLFI